VPHAHMTIKRPVLSPFWAHFWQMFGVMVVGMIGAAAIFVTALGLTWEEATLQHPTAALAVVAAGMSIPMAGWMLHRGMGWRNSSEMAGAMALPVIPFLCLVLVGSDRQRRLRAVLPGRHRRHARAHAPPTR
jgi:hypothetical protein